MESQRINQITQKLQLLHSLTVQLQPTRLLPVYFSIPVNQYTVVQS